MISRSATHGQLASLPTAADDWNHTEVGEESEMDSQHDFQELQMQLHATLAAKKEQDVALEQLRKFVWDYRKSIFMTTFLAELPLTLKRFLNME